MLLKPDKSDFILSMIKVFEAHEARIYWILMKNSEVKNKHKNKYAKLKAILSIFYFKRKIFPDGRLSKQKARLCAHVITQQWRVSYWETYAPVLNWISGGSLLVITSIHELPSISIDFLLAFPQADLDADVFMKLHLGILVYGNRV